MTNPHRNASGTPGDMHGEAPGDEGLAPLPGELGIPNVAAPRPVAVSKKGLFAVGVMVLSLIAVTAIGIQRFAAHGRKGAEDSRLARDKPAAATTEPRRLEIPLPASAAAANPSPRIPALIATDDEAAEPIGVRRKGSELTGSTSNSPTTARPEDAPVLLVASRDSSPASSRAPGLPPSGTGVASQPAEPADDAIAATSRNLQAYQRQLQGVLEDLTKSAEQATASADPQLPTPGQLPAQASAARQPLASAGSAGLFDGQLHGSVTPKISAAKLGNRSLTLPKGTAFTCALKTKVISAASGLVGCQVLRNVFSDDGRVLLIERGSHLDGEYRITSVRPGMVRIPILWTRIRTPMGVTVDIESPATGQLGEAGIDGYVDNRWSERIGAAMLLSLIDDSVKLVIQSQANDRQGDTVVLPSTTSNTSKLAEKVLDSTINIPPLISQNQGGIVGIYVARDVDFSAVYDLVPTEERPQRP